MREQSPLCLSPFRAEPGAPLNARQPRPPAAAAVSLTGRGALPAAPGSGALYSAFQISEVQTAQGRPGRLTPYPLPASPLCRIS